MQLEQVTENVWTVEQQIKLLPGVYLPARSVILRLRSGGLLIFSPLPRLTRIADDIRALGEVKALIAPNLFHHLGLPKAVAAFPGARVFGPAALKQKRADVTYSGALEDGPDPQWSEEVEQLALEGFKKLDEFEFYHRDSGTLILGDVVFNVQKTEGLLSRFVLTLSRSRGRFGPSRILKSLVVDRAAARRSAERILQWAPQRVIVLHGEIVDSDAPERLKKALSELQG